MAPASFARPSCARFSGMTPRRAHRIESLETRRLLAAGALDPAFGGDGTVVTDMTGPVEALAAEVSLATPDGKLLVAGHTRNAGGWNFALARFHADGSLDTTFGTGGRVVTDVNGGAFDVIADADILPDGKIVVAGTTGPSPWPEFDNGGDFAVARYHADGSPDTTFGNGGVVVTDVGGLLAGSGASGADVAEALSVAPGGKLVVVGRTGFPGSGDVAVARYNANGSLDPTFGRGGLVATNAYPESDDGETSASDDGASDVYVHPDGRVLVGGHARGEFLLVRYLPDGRIDRSFGRGHGPDYEPPPEDPGEGFGDAGDPGDGFVTTRFPGAAASIADFAIVGGRITAVGSAVTGENASDFAVARYDLRGGSLDRTFSVDGKVTVDFVGARDEASAVLVRRDGTVFVAGFATMPDTLEDFALTRLDMRGRRVASFGTGGKVTTDFGAAGGPTVDRAADATFTPDGRIVLSGAAAAVPGGDWGVSGMRFGLVRYFTSGATDPTFGGAGNGRATAHFLGSLASHGSDVVLQGDGKVIVGGVVLSGGTLHDILLTRYNADGSLDATFGAGGHVVTDFSVHSDGRSTDQLAAVALDPLGRIVVVGATDRRAPGASEANGVRRWDWFVARYRPDGRADRTFGGGRGFVVTDLGAADEYPTDVAVTPGGRIVVLGNTRAAGETWQRVTVVRYLNSGARDTSFSGDGVVATDLPEVTAEHADALALQADGKLVVAGTAYGPNSGQNFALLRYAADGSLDPTFGGGDGWLTTDIATWDGARAVAVQGDGRIVAAGTAEWGFAPSFTDMAVARYLPDGSVDPSFGGGAGHVIVAPHANPNRWDAANDVLVQADGKLVLAGVSVQNDGPGVSSAADFAAVRLLPDGTRDAGFGAGGATVIGLGGWAVAHAAAIDPVRGIVLAGGVFANGREPRPTGSDVAVARLLR